MSRCYTLSTPIEVLTTHFGFDGGVAYPTRLTIVPGEPICIVRIRPGYEANGRRELAIVRWGLVPHWVKDIAAFGTLTNARAETIIEKPSFRAPLRHRRCIVPADGWTVFTGKATRKVPHHIRPAAGGPVAFAALWDHWLGADGSEIETAAIITAPAAAAIAAYDERMPVLLDKSAVDRWLDVRGVDPDAAVELLPQASVPEFVVTSPEQRGSAG